VEEFLNSSLPVAYPVKHFTPNEVKYVIDKYPLKESPGFDYITAEVARCLPKKAIIHLTHLFNSILRLSYFPILWKFSFQSPIKLLIPSLLIDPLVCCVFSLKSSKDFYLNEFYHA